MTERQKWHVADDDRENIAEYVNDGAGQLATVRKKLPKEFRAEILEVELSLSLAMQLLKTNGAKTTIPDPLKPSGNGSSPALAGSFSGR